MKQGASAQVIFISGQTITAAQDPTMESEPKARKERDPMKTVISVMTALIFLSFGLIGYIIYDNSLRSETVSKVVVDGSTVLMNYIGMFDDGRVFDTSIYDVAEDNALYPKSFTFSMREQSAYTPFEMTAGLYGESGGTIKGFALGVIGMQLNEKSIIVVSPEDGYAVDPAMLETIDLLEEVPAVETVPEAEFTSLFGSSATLMTIVPHYKWGWDVLVVQIASGYVTFKSMPTVGEVVAPYGDPYDPEFPAGWDCVVESYDASANDGAGSIKVRHLLTEADTYNREGEDYTGVQFVLSAVDEEAGTFTIHKIDMDTGYNGEISGRTLLFEVTIVNIT